MKRLFVLAAAALACGSLAVAAYSAAPKKEDKPNPPSAAQIAKGMKIGPEAVVSAGLKCTLKNAADLGSAMVDGPDKGKVKAELVEVACTEGLGYIIRHVETGKSDAYNCLQVEAAYEQSHKGARCSLPENTSAVAQLQPMFAKTGAKCTLSDAAAVGATPTFMRFEVACTEGMGYQFDVMNSGEVRPGVISCLEADAGANPCKLTTKAQAVAQLVPLAQQADKNCKVSDARWIGTTSDSHNTYYEIGCTGRPGFILEANAAGAYVRTHDCLSAQAVGGCKFTDVAQAKASASSGFGGALQSHGVTCTIADFKDVGHDSAQRELVEFKCPEHAWGLVALIPAAGTSAKFETMDCISAKERAYDCTLTDKAAILANLKPILTAVGKTCDPTDYKVLGPGDFGDTVEVKCSAGQGGFVVDLPPGRAKTAKTMTCVQAKGGVNECTIPGNS
jgi:hypothetical protein